MNKDHIDHPQCLINACWPWRLAFHLLPWPSLLQNFSLLSMHSTLQHVHVWSWNCLSEKNSGETETDRKTHTWTDYNNLSCIRTGEGFSLDQYVWNASTFYIVSLHISGRPSSCYSCQLHETAFITWFGTSLSDCRIWITIVNYVLYRLLPWDQHWRTWKTSPLTEPYITYISVV